MLPLLLINVDHKIHLVLEQFGISVSKAYLIFQVSQTCYRYMAQLKEQNVIIADWLIKLTNEK